MPHPTNMVVPIKVADGAAPPPDRADVAAILETIFTAKTSAASIEAAYALCEILLNSVGARGLTEYGITASFTAPIST